MFLFAKYIIEQKEWIEDLNSMTTHILLPFSPRLACLCTHHTCHYYVAIGEVVIVALVTLFFND